MGVMAVGGFQAFEALLKGQILVLERVGNPVHLCKSFVWQLRVCQRELKKPPESLIEKP